MVPPEEGVYIDPDMVELLKEFLQTIVQEVPESEHVTPPVNEQLVPIRLLMLIRELRRLEAQSFGGHTDFMKADQ